MQPLGNPAAGSTEQTSSMQQQQQQTTPRRRSSLWDRISAGFYNASQADIQGMRTMDAAGFAPAGAKFEGTFGNSALYESGLSRPKRDEAWKRERNELAEDALRQMS